MKIKTSSHRLVVVIALLVGLSHARSNAQVITASETLSDFGDLSQYNSGVTYTNNLNVQPVACAPTSFINAFTYLNNVNDGDIFAHSPDTYADLNAMAGYMGTSYNTYYTAQGNPYQAGGTQYADAATGNISYDLSTGFNPAQTAITVSGQFVYPATAGRGLGAKFNNTFPSASFLGDALNSNSAVELGIQWGTYANGTFTPSASGGCHVVDLYSLNLNNGSGAAGILDPISFSETLDDPNAVANPDSATLSTVTINGSNALYLTYSGGAFAGPEPETGGADDPNYPNSADFGAANGQTALVVADWVESVPEPSSWALGLVAFGGMIFLVRTSQKNTAETE